MDSIILECWNIWVKEIGKILKSEVAQYDLPLEKVAVATCHVRVVSEPGLGAIPLLTMEVASIYSAAIMLAVIKRVG